MTTYKGIKGFTAQTLSSDPTTASSVGQIYYNSTGNVFKYVTPGGVAAATYSFTISESKANTAAMTSAATISVTTTGASTTKVDTRTARCYSRRKEQRC